MNWQWFEALGNSERTSPGFRAVGLVLAVRAKRDDAKCNPSIRNICKYASVGHTTACRAIRHFEKLGMLRVERGRGKANTYHLSVPVSGTPSVPDTGTPSERGECSSQWNTKGESVLHSGTQVFPRVNAEREHPLKPFRVQGDNVEENDSEVPY